LKKLTKEISKMKESLEEDAAIKNALEVIGVKTINKLPQRDILERKKDKKILELKKSDHRRKQLLNSRDAFEQAMDKLIEYKIKENERDELAEEVETLLYKKVSPKIEELQGRSKLAKVEFSDVEKKLVDINKEIVPLLKTQKMLIESWNQGEIKIESKI